MYPLFILFASCFIYSWIVYYKDGIDKWLNIILFEDECNDDVDMCFWIVDGLMYDLFILCVFVFVVVFRNIGCTNCNM